MADVLYIDQLDGAMYKGLFECAGLDGRPIWETAGDIYHGARRFYTEQAAEDGPASVQS